jgi:hypothetical protein
MLEMSFAEQGKSLLRVLNSQPEPLRLKEKGVS